MRRVPQEPPDESMTGLHRPRYLSPSRLWAYDRCPQVYADRYIRKLEQPPSFEREYGTAVHAGLEAHFRGLDYEMAFLLAWRSATKILKAAGVTAPAWLTSRGLELIESVRGMGITGEPEQRISVIVAGISVPIIGYADLIAEGVIYDFKTTGWGWTQQHADREMFQPVIYSQAYAEAHNGEYPAFRFIVLPRNGSGGLVELDGTRNSRQVFETFERARAIHVGIEAQQWDCLCKGKYCQLAEAAA
jgi:PD-(D/E)XK nuclease superfamily protein